MKTQAWSVKMERVKQVADISIVGGGAITAPVWITHISEINAIVAMLTGLLGLAYVALRLYYLIKSKGKTGG